MLPLVLKRAVMLAAVCLAAVGITVFCAAITGVRDTEPKLRVGYVADDNMLTNLAVSYVQGMESVKSLCSLEPVTEQEGKARLAEGSLSALMVMPSDVINEILSGSNTPAALYLPEKKGENALAQGGIGAVGSMLFEELASAGIGMLGTAQAEIYASDAILQELGGASVERRQSVYDDINKFNLASAMSREDLFRTKQLSVTENDTYVIYFGSAFLTIYVLLAGLFFGEFCKRNDLWQRIADRRLGVGYAAQLFARCLAGIVLMSAVILLPAAVYTMAIYAAPQLRAVFSIKMTLAGAAGLLVVAVFMTVYNMMLYQMVEKRGAAVVAVGISALPQAYMSGCLIPSVLLPKAVAEAGKFVPAAFVKKCFTVFLTGDAKGLSGAARGLLAWGIVMFAAAFVFMHIGGREGTGSVSWREHKRRIPSVAGVLFRRMLHSKSIWIFMLIFAAASVLIIKAEKKSETRIIAAVYDESGGYETLLKNYDGLVSFQMYAGKEQVVDAVLRGNAECGYVLPKTLAEDMMGYRANGSVIVYQDEDTVAAPVVNEILFERIFRKVSLEWYCGYVCGFGEDRVALRKMAAEHFERELSGGTTFRFEVKRLGSVPRADDTEKRAVYPLHAAAAAVVVLCALQGAAQAVSDIRNNRFYKRNRAAMAAITVAMPVVLSMLVAGLVVLFGL